MSRDTPRRTDRTGGARTPGRWGGGARAGAGEAPTSDGADSVALSLARGPQTRLGPQEAWSHRHGDSTGNPTGGGGSRLPTGEGEARARAWNAEAAAQHAPKATEPGGALGLRGQRGLFAFLLDTRGPLRPSGQPLLFRDLADGTWRAAASGGAVATYTDALRGPGLTAGAAGAVAGGAARSPPRAARPATPPPPPPTPGSTPGGPNGANAHPDFKGKGM